MKKLKIETERIKESGRIEENVPEYACEAIGESVRRQVFNLHFTVLPVDNEFYLTGEIDGEIQIDCCRCLETFVYPLHLKMAQSYPAATAEIDVEEEVRQLLILNLPAKPLCSTDCKGICPQCGKNKNIEPCQCSSEYEDPRWGKLKNLIKKEK